MPTMDDKLSTIVNQMPFETGMPFGNMIVKHGFGRSKDLYEIRISGKNNGLLIPELAMSILSARDLFELPGKNFMKPELNPVSIGILTFCETFKDADKKDLEEYGREVLLEGLQSSKFSMSENPDVFKKYNLLFREEIFRNNLGPKGLKRIGVFFRSYGRLPYPDERLDKPKTIRLFKEQIEFVIGAPISIPGEESKKLLVNSDPIKSSFYTDRIFFVNSRQSKFFDPEDKQSWIFKVSIKDAPGCICSGLTTQLLSVLASYDNSVLSGRNINIFEETLKKHFVLIPYINKIVYKKNIDALKIKTNESTDRYYAKGFIPFMLATGRFPTMNELGDYKKRLEQER